MKHFSRVDKNTPFSRLAGTLSKLAHKMPTVVQQASQPSLKSQTMTFQRGGIAATGDITLNRKSALTDFFQTFMGLLPARGWWELEFY